MSERFVDLSKIPNEPAARLLAAANVKLDSQLSSPASAGVEAVLEELDQLDAAVDQLRLIATALPPRERTWWACLAARDIVGDAPHPTVVAAEAWVRQPTNENRLACEVAVEQADGDDETVNCCNVAIFSGASTGDGPEMAYEPPIGGSESMAMAMNASALGTHEEEAAAFLNHLIDRAADIARGGDGRIEFDAAVAD